MRPPKGKQKLLDAAAELFVTRGYFATTIEQITAHAGVSKGLVYNYFSSKEELLKALLAQGTERMAAVASSQARPRTLDEALADFVDAYFNFLNHEREFLKMQLNMLLTPELESVVAEPQRQRAELLLASMCELLRRSAVAEPLKKARILLALFDGIALHHLRIFAAYPLTSMKAQVLASA